MKAACWHGTHDVQVETVPDPKILNPRDAIVKVTSTTICGSDLHLFRMRFLQDIWEQICATFTQEMWLRFGGVVQWDNLQ